MMLDVFGPSPEELSKRPEQLIDPVSGEPLRPRPSRAVLLERKRRVIEYWRPRNLRMLEDEATYKLVNPVEDRIGQEELGASETLILNDPYVLVEKLANMLSSTEPVIEHIPIDPGMKDISQKVEDFLWWWWDEANNRWVSKLNNILTRDEVYYLALRGWLCGRILLDPGDNDFPFRYDLIDPIHVYPVIGSKDLRYVWHIYRDAKINILEDLGWDNAVLQRIEEALHGFGDLQDVEVASYFDDIWHVLYINDTEVWSAPHNYGFVPWVIAISYGPPIRRTDNALVGPPTSLVRSRRTDHTRWHGVSAFEGIKDIYQKLNKLASAILTEAMKAPNPPIVIFTNPASGEVEGKKIETAIGSTSYLINGQENFQVVQYGFRPSELSPLLQLLTDARNRGSLPAVMYGEGANFLSGFAVSLLQRGSQDLIYPLVTAHQHYKQRVNECILRLTAEVYQLPINMIRTDPKTGNRTIYTTITSDEIKAVGYKNRVVYRDIGPQDQQLNATTAALLVDKKLMSLDTARRELLKMRNPTLENMKVLGDLAYFDLDVVKTALPDVLYYVDPWLWMIYQRAQYLKTMQSMLMMQQSSPPKAGDMAAKGGEAPSANPPKASEETAVNAAPPGYPANSPTPPEPPSAGRVAS